jgi:hypothetical protein
MKKIYYIFAIIAFVFTSCDKSDVNNGILPSSSSTSATAISINRATRPIELGNKKNNPFTVENMQAALDTLRAHPDSLSGCMKAPSTSLDDIEITTTDLYVRFLPQDSTQYKQLKNDTTLTLFDFPLDYEIKQDGDYYKDPTLTGNYTWLYTRVPVGYQPPAGITYEVLANLFIMENSPYYSEEKMSSVGAMKAKSEFATNRNEALKTIKAIAFFITGNPYGDIKSTQTPSFSPTGLMRVAKSVKHKFLWWSWTTTDYYPSGTIKVQGYHQMNSSAGVTNYSTSTDVPLKGVKIQLWSWFKWVSAYTNENGYYESDTSFDLDPQHYIYFTGRNGNNSWDLDRVWFWGVCMWVQKYSLGAHSRDNYDATICNNSDAWDACLTNNAFYEYMTICDKEGMSRPPAHLQVALRVYLSGSSSAPLFQNHTNTLTTSVLAGFCASTFVTAGATAPATAAYMGFLNSLPDILLSGGSIKEYQTNKDWSLSEKDALSEHYSTIWHELSHASDFQQMKNDKGYWPASGYWSSLIGTEVGHSMLTFGGSSYGSKGDSNWEQVALCEGWAYYRGWKLGSAYLSYGSNKDNKSEFPRYFHNMFTALKSFGCSDADMEKCLNVKTFSEFKQQLKNIYSGDKTRCGNIEERINYFYNY